MSKGHFNRWYSRLINVTILSMSLVLPELNSKITRKYLLSTTCTFKSKNYLKSPFTVDFDAFCGYVSCTLSYLIVEANFATSIFCLCNVYI